MSSVDDAVEPRDVIASQIDTAQEVAAVDAPIDLKESGLSQRDALLKLSDEVKPWRSLEREAVASLTIFADNDAAVLNAAKSCETRWKEARREVGIVTWGGGANV